MTSKKLPFEISYENSRSFHKLGRFFLKIGWRTKAAVALNLAFELYPKLINPRHLRNDISFKKHLNNCYELLQLYDSVIKLSKKFKKAWRNVDERDMTMDVMRFLHRADTFIITMLEQHTNEMIALVESLKSGEIKSSAINWDTVDYSHYIAEMFFEKKKRFSVAFDELSSAITINLEKDKSLINDGLPDTGDLEEK